MAAAVVIADTLPEEAVSYMERGDVIGAEREYPGSVTPHSATDSARCVLLMFIIPRIILDIIPPLFTGALKAGYIACVDK